MTLRKRVCAAVLVLSLIAASCGTQVDNPGPVSDAEQSRHEEAADSTRNSGDGISAAVDFYYMEVDSRLSSNLYRSYDINHEWLYVTDWAEAAESAEENDDNEENGDSAEDNVNGYFSITRKRISDGYQEKDYAVSSLSDGKPFLLADQEGNCYIYWTLYHFDAETNEVETTYRLEKYGKDGKQMWSTEFAAEELKGMGDSLGQGTVTGDGRVILYRYGTEGSVFVFGESGGLEEVYTPELDSLEGVAVGKDNRIYGYCFTGAEPVFMELGEEGKRFVCPVTPLAVYSGYEEGLCLRTGEGMLSYIPESGETEKLWEWKDEYIQIDGNQVDRVFQKDGTYMLLCLEMIFGDRVKPLLTFSAITPGGGGDYPVRQAVTFAVPDLNAAAICVPVQLYNRQSRKYRIEVLGEDTLTYEKKLIQGIGADLMDVTTIYRGNLARHGAFEELDSYFESSQVVSSEDIVDSVRAASVINGKNVVVIPGFHLSTFRARGDLVTPEEWTVWKFLEMGEKDRMFSYQSPESALDLCMGMQYGEHFIDYENKTCSFDGEEFKRILESCGRWKTYDDGSNIPYNTQKGDWLFDMQGITGAHSVIPWKSNVVPGLVVESISNNYEYTGENYLDTLVGYPGWEGGEYKIAPKQMIAINSASKNKEGAWDFLEYLLSDEMQAMFYRVSGSMPARKDYFEEHLRHSYSDPAYSSDWTREPTEADIERVREMAEAAVVSSGGQRTDPVASIVREEASMYFAGDATLDATVQKIQTRVLLYLDEL